MAGDVGIKGVAGPKDVGIEGVAGPNVGVKRKSGGRVTFTVNAKPL